MSGARATVGIVGGGPAGSSLAIRLRRMGHTVLIVTDGRCRYAVQGLSERAIVALRQLDAPRALRTIGAPASRLVLWNGLEAQPNDECLVDRPAFDLALLTDAEHAGARVLSGSVARGSLPASGSLKVVSREGCREASADLWVEARGRSALRSGQATCWGPPTLTVQQPIQSAPGRPWSAVVALPDGWCWMGTQEDGRGIIQRSLHRGRGRAAGTPRAPGTRGTLGAPTDLLHSTLSNHPALENKLRDARGTGRVRGFATETALQIGGPLPLRVGDALTAPDPLSGHGVCEALANSRYAAAAVNTMLRRPGSAGLAHQFLADRARERYAILAAIGLHSYRQEQRWTTHEFWATRRAEPANTESPVKASPEIRQGPVLVNDEIVLRDILILPRHPRGVWRVHDVPVVDLIAEVRAGNAAEKAAAALRVSPQQAARAMHWLVAQGIRIDLHG